MNKKTAVEWLIEQLSGHDLFNTRTENSFRNHNNMIKIEEIIEEAKEMEKQQIIEAYNDGWSNSNKHEFKSAERYYNELHMSEYDKHQQLKKGCTGPK